jgi:two-component system NtrC family sensor kinase
MSHLILLVDDEPAALRGLLRTLHSTPLEFASVDSAAEALDVLERRPVDVIVTDQRMPGMTGDQLLEVVAQRWPATVRIMLTGETDAEVVRRAINLGHVHQFLLKPCDSATLLSAMRAALQRIDLERAGRELLRATAARSRRLRRGARADDSTSADEPGSDGAWHLEPPAGDLDQLIRSMKEVAARPTTVADLEEASTGWRTIADGITDLIGLLDGEGAIRRVNRTLETWKIAAIRASLGRPLHEVLHPGCTAADCEVACWIQNVLLGRDGGAESEIVDPLLKRRLRLRASPAARGEEPGWLVVLHDATAEHELRSESARLHAHLLQAQKLEEIGRLAAGVAHEINTPAQFVRDNLEFLKTSVDALLRSAQLHRELLAAVEAGGDAKETAARQREALAELDLDFVLAEAGKAAAEGLEGIGRVATIVRALKEFSHPGESAMGKIDLRRAIESTVTVARNEWKYVAQVEIEVEPGLPAIDGYGGELNQVFLNLLVNAAQAIGEKPKAASSDPGRITIRARRDADHVAIRFEDNGPGIPESVRRHIFEPFFTTKPAGKGTGQGLALARSVVVGKHKGSLDVETEVGRGTTFVLRLPIAAACEQPLVGTPGAAGPPASSG